MDIFAFLRGFSRRFSFGGLFKRKHSSPKACAAVSKENALKQNVSTPLIKSFACDKIAKEHLFFLWRVILCLVLMLAFSFPKLDLNNKGEPS